jgi:hypothetical protein
MLRATVAVSMLPATSALSLKTREAESVEALTTFLVCKLLP